MQVAELKRAILPHFGTEIPHPNSINQSSNHHFVSRESLPNLTSRVKPLEVHCNNGQKVRQPAIKSGDNVGLPELSFNRLQATDEECNGLPMHQFSQYIVREAVLDEECWAAAWLRAEARSESMPYTRHIDADKRKYAEQEFYALKRRCLGPDGNSLKCFCLVAVKREEKNVQRTVLSSVVGTLDLSIRQFFPGAYPGNKQYGYIANVCVSKSTRRQGIASNLLHLASDMAIASGMKHLFVHVNADNKGAQELYSKAGFEFTKGGVSPSSNDHTLLMLKEL